MAGQKRLLLALAAQERMLFHQMDVETAFLHGILEEVYMVQPEGHETQGKEEQVCKLHRSIYGLKQSPRCWNNVLDDGMEFTATGIDGLLLVAVYVDDLLLAGRSQEEIERIKKDLSFRFRM